MKGREGKKEGRERLLVAAQDPGPARRDPHPSFSSGGGGTRSLPPVGTRIPRLPLPASLAFLSSFAGNPHPSILPSGALHPSILSPRRRGTRIPLLLLGVTCFPPPFLPPGRNPHPSTLPPHRGNPHPSILQGRNPHPSPSSRSPASLRPSLPPRTAPSLLLPHPLRFLRGCHAAGRLGPPLPHPRSHPRLSRGGHGPAPTCCPQPLRRGGAERGTFHSCFHTPGPRRRRSLAGQRLTSPALAPTPLQRLWVHQWAGEGPGEVRTRAARPRVAPGSVTPIATTIAHHPRHHHPHHHHHHHHHHSHPHQHYH